MKVTSVALAIAAMGSVNAGKKEFSDKKTPFQRRIEKSFGLFDEWAALQMAGHSKFSELHAELDNKEQHKLDMIRDKVVGYYRKTLAKKAEECETELENCEEYLSCSGFGDRLRDLTRSKPLVSESDYFLEFTKAHLKRSVRKSFSAKCGAESEKLNEFISKFNTVVEKARGWRAQCDRYANTDCPSHCELIERKKGVFCMPQGWTRPVKTD